MKIEPIYINKVRKGFTLISKSFKGFTLIELLVVISIIGILATLIISNFMSAQRQANDARRKSDIDQIRKALELYKNNQTIPAYPPNKNALSPTYMNPLPNDPKYSCDVDGCWSNYAYTRDPANSGDLLTYSIKACLENSTDPQRDSVNTCTLGYSFTRSEP